MSFHCVLRAPSRHIMRFLHLRRLRSQSLDGAQITWGGKNDISTHSDSFTSSVYLTAILEDFCNKTLLCLICFPGDCPLVFSPAEERIAKQCSKQAFSFDSHTKKERLSSVHGGEKDSVIIVPQDLNQSWLLNCWYYHKNTGTNLHYLYKQEWVWNQTYEQNIPFHHFHVVWA